MTKTTMPEPVAWLYEDELPDNYPYDTMFPYSKVDGVRMFPVYAPLNEYDKSDAVPLYAHPAPNSQVNLDSSNHIADDSKMVVLEGWQLVPKNIDPALLVPFAECPTDELLLAWNAVLHIAPKYIGE